jgi:hypothetical protein
MENINIWNLSEQIYSDELLREIDVNVAKNSETFLLDMKKTNYSVLEKYVYDIAMFHLKRLQNTENNESECGECGEDEIKDKYYVEFWVKDRYQHSTLHVDCDENLKKQELEYSYPLLSSVTYLNDCDIPTVITNIDMDRYMYKDFEKNLNLFFSFPKKGKQITFDGKYYHGSALLNNDLDNTKSNPRYILLVNLWDKQPTNISYYNNSNNIITDVVFDSEKLLNLMPEELQEETNLKTIGLDKDVMNYRLFEAILYNNKNKCVFTIFDPIINKDKSEQQQQQEEQDKIYNYKIFLDETIEQKKLESQLKIKYGNILEDAKEIMDGTKELKYNRFLQRFLHPKIYCQNACSWIINECEKYAENNGGWTTKRHLKYPTTDLPVESVKPIIGFIFESLKTITGKIKKSYGLNDEIVIDYRDLFIVKYKEDQQNFLEIHQDGSFLSFNVLLSDVSEFEGGGTYFDDGLIMKGEQGDLILHSSKMKHSGLPITKGTRYLFVGFANMNLGMN